MNIEKLLDDLRAIDVKPDVRVVQDGRGGHAIIMQIYFTGQVAQVDRMKPEDIVRAARNMVMSLYELLIESADKLDSFLEIKNE